MNITKEQISKAKEKIGERASDIIAEILHLEKYDSKNHKALCPFHKEDTPSFIYNTKDNYFHCFGCGRTVGLLDAYIATGNTYLEAVEKLSDESGIPISLGEKGVRTKYQYRYPKEEQRGAREAVLKYLAVRGISQETADKLDVRQDAHGNIVFNYYDTNDVLTMVKYRPSHKIVKGSGEPKCWFQKDADTNPLLYNMNRVVPELPLLLTEGEIDTMAAIESGYTNAVSIPFGCHDFKWIEENFDWLEQFDSIIVCSDNDVPGVEMQKECVFRLGSWRTKVIDIPRQVTDADGVVHNIKDLNEVLFYCGKQAVLDLIQSAKDSPVPSVDDLSDVHDIDLDEIDGIYTGIQEVDSQLMKLFYGTLTVVSGTPGCVDCATEFFNGKEWKPISQYIKGDKVLQYNDDGTASLVYPERYIKAPCDKFYWIKSRGVDQMVSGEHNLVYITSKGNLAKKDVKSFLRQHEEAQEGFGGKFITSFHYEEGLGVPYTDNELRLMCAVICEGSFTNKYSKSSWVFNRVRVNLKKKRKIDRLTEILNKLQIPYEIKQWNPNDPDYRTFIFVPPIRTKEFPNEWYKCSHHQMEVIADEIINWDGSKNEDGGISFSSTVKENIDFIQFCFAATGRRTHIHAYDRVGQKRGGYTRKSVEYELSIYTTLSNLATIHSSKEKLKIPEVKPADGLKYCFTVPSGMLVLRRNGTINVTGNSGKSSFLSQLICQAMEQGKNTWLFSREMPGWMSKSWLNYILASGNNVRAYKDSNGTPFYKVPNDVKELISDYYRGKWYVYKDDASNKLDDLLISMTDSVKKYGTRLLILDNLMTIDLGSNESNELLKQTDAITKLIGFAMKYNTAVVLVAHPRKMQSDAEVGIYDISGSSNIINLAHRTIGISRIKNKEDTHDVRLTIIKDRMRGRAGEHIDLYYDVPTRRFYTNEKEYNFQYSWDQSKHPYLPYPHEEENEVYGEIHNE